MLTGVESRQLIAQDGRIAGVETTAGRIRGAARRGARGRRLSGERRMARAPPAGAGRRAYAGRAGLRWQHHRAGARRRGTARPLGAGQRALVPELDRDPRRRQHRRLSAHRARSRQARPDRGQRRRPPVRRRGGLLPRVRARDVPHAERAGLAGLRSRLHPALRPRPDPAAHAEPAEVHRERLPAGCAHGRGARRADRRAGRRASRRRSRAPTASPRAASTWTSARAATSTTATTATRRSGRTPASRRSRGRRSARSASSRRRSAPGSASSPTRRRASAMPRARRSRGFTSAAATCTRCSPASTPAPARSSARA